MTIANDQVYQILRDAGFTITNTPSIGDVGVYMLDGDPVHSVTRTYGDMVVSRSGMNPVKTLPAGPGPGTAWNDSNATITWYKRK